MTRLLAFVALVGTGVFARAQDALPPNLRDVGLDQRLDEQVPLDLEFRDESNKPVQLGDYFDGKPVILVLAYYRCPMLCTQVLNALVDSLRGISFDAGDQFQVVVVSFDARERFALAAAKKGSYVGSYGRPGTANGWHFLTGQQSAIDELTQAVGFRYAFDKEHDQFAHASGIVVLTPKGKIARYFFGIDYPPRDLRLTLVEASNGKIGSPVDKLLLLCYHYDPSAGKYTAQIMSILRLGGVLTLAALGFFFARAWYRGRQKQPLTKQAIPEA